MNGRERLIKTLNRQPVDRVPVAPFIYNNFICEFFDSQTVDLVERGIEVYEHFGFDPLLRTCNVWDYMDEKFCDCETWKVTETVESHHQDEWTVTTVIRTPEKELTQRKRHCRTTKYEVVEAVLEYYIKEPEDFEQFLKYQPPVPKYDCTVIEKAHELLECKGIAAPWIQGAFNSVSFYRALDSLIIDPYIDPCFYDSMINHFSARMLKVAEQFVKAGADLLCAGGNVANFAMVGPQYFEKYVLPYEIEFANRIRSMQVFYLYHNCGDASGLLRFYNRIGMDIYESLTQPPYGDTNFDFALQTIDKDIIISGNIDQIDFLKSASPDMVAAQVKTVIEKGKQRGNFILGTSDYFSEGTPHENILAFAQAGAKYGKYYNSESNL